MFQVLGASAQQQLENVNVHGRKHLDNLNSMMNDLKIGFQKCPTNQGIMVVDLIQNFKQFTEDHILNKEGDTLHNDGKYSLLFLTHQIYQEFLCFCVFR